MYLSFARVRDIGRSPYRGEASEAIHTLVYSQ